MARPESRDGVAAGRDRPFGVVFVCTGNRFRSPLAEAAFRRAAGDAPVDVASCGTLRLDSAPALREAVAEASRLGLDLSRHVSRCISKRAVADADLVLGFERQHGQAAVRLGARRERVFLLLELVLLLERVRPRAATDPRERAAAAVAAAHRLRVEGAGAAAPPDLADPFAKPPEYQRYVAERVTELSERLASSLFGRR